MAGFPLGSVQMKLLLRKKWLHPEFKTVMAAGCYHWQKPIEISYPFGSGPWSQEPYNSWLILMDSRPPRMQKWDLTFMGSSGWMKEPMSKHRMWDSWECCQLDSFFFHKNPIFSSSQEDLGWGRELCQGSLGLALTHALGMWMKTYNPVPLRSFQCRRGEPHSHA